MMPRFLIVNDDGKDSPMLPEMIDKLGTLGEVLVVVPVAEQSWKAKAITRHDLVRVESRHYAGAVESFNVHGTPADCVNLAIHHLLDTPPDWVVSGINIGYNAGLGVILNSGTVGAAIEAALLNVPAFAFSVRMPPTLFKKWMQTRQLTEQDAHEIIQSCTTKMIEIVAEFSVQGLSRYDSGSNTLPPVFNINFPSVVTEHTLIQWTYLDSRRYGSVFERKEADLFKHRLNFEQPEQSKTLLSDVNALDQQQISITELDLNMLSVRQRL